MAGVQATSGLTTTKAPFIEQAQAEGRLYIHQPYELYSEANHDAWQRLFTRHGGSLAPVRQPALPAGHRQSLPRRQPGAEAG